MWLYGVLLACCGSVFSCTGLNLQRLSQVRNAALPTHCQIPAHKQPLNIIGVLFMILESFLDMAAYEFSSSSTLAPFSALTLTLNMILAPAISKEKIHFQDCFVSAMVFLGTTISVRFSNHEPPNLDLSALVKVLTRPSALICLAIFCFWILSLSIIIRAFDPAKASEYEYRRRLIDDNEIAEVNPGDTRTDEPARSTNHSFCNIMSWAGSFKTAAPTRYNRGLHRCALPLFAGSIGACTALLAKSLNELISVTISGNNQFIYGGSWVVAVLLIISASTQVKFLNKSLRFYESLWVVPLYTSSYILMASSFTSMMLGDLQRLRGLQLLGFFLGILLTLSGISVLLLRPTNHRVEPVLDEPTTTNAYS